MSRFLTIAIAVYWAGLFAILATGPDTFLAAGRANGGWQAGSALSGLLPAGGAMVVVLAATTACALVAVLFAWMAITGLSSHADRQADVSSIARPAFAAAIAVLVAMLSIDLATGASARNASWITLQIAALAVSWRVAAGRGPAIPADPPHASADRMPVVRDAALQAAHMSTFSPISRHPFFASQDQI